MAMTPDFGIAAMREIREATEGLRGRLDVFGGFAGEDEEARPPARLIMVSSNGDGRISEECLTLYPELAKKFPESVPATIEGEVAKPALPRSTE
jgi:hypothetical protein